MVFVNDNWVGEVTSCIKPELCDQQEKQDIDTASL